jgi:hypothetical protein
VIKRKRKICKGCNTPQYIFSGGYCQTCWAKQNIQSRAPQRRIERRSPPQGSKPPLKARKPLKQRSDKREGQETEYRKLIKEIDRKAKEGKRMECFFCGRAVENAEHHHLKGREEDLLLEEKYIVRVHSSCHWDFHHAPIKQMTWFIAYLCRLAELDERLYHRERARMGK